MFKNLGRRAMAAAALFALASLHFPLRAADAAPGPAALAPLKIGFVYVSPIGDAGWTYQHNEGRLAMQKALGDEVQVSVVENVAEGPDSERVMREMAASGHRLVFATSFGYLDPALRVAREYPGVAFEHMGGYKTAANLNTYNARFYEGRYLAGVVAGHMSRAGLAGYVAGFPIPEVVQGINAFAQGMRSVNPKAQVKVLFLNTWFDPGRERDAAQALANQGADVLTHHTGSTAIPAFAEEKGVMLLAYQSDMRRVAPNVQLTSVTHHWGAYYTAVAEAVRAGTWKPQPFWGGLRENVIRLAPFSPKVPAEVVAQVRERERLIAAGRLHPFGGRITEASGRVRQGSGAMADADILRMDYFVEGVQGVLPRF
jgi:simple sugar transport system substrate-binding protein